MTPDEALNLLFHYPIIILLVLDGYEPRLAGVLIEALQDLDDESARLTIGMFALDAERGLEEARN